LRAAKPEVRGGDSDLREWALGQNAEVLLAPFRAKLEQLGVRVRQT
jgi:hypothetical protein